MSNANDFPGIFRCPACEDRTPISVLHKDSKYINCSCGSKIIYTEGEVYDNTQKEKFKTTSFIKVGFKFEYEQEDYQVIGRAVVRTRYTSYEGEEPYTGSLQYEEWICKNEDGSDEIVITKDKYGYNISRPIEPTNMENPSGQASLSFFEDQPYQLIFEKGHCLVLYFEGESTERYVPEDRFYYALYKYRGITYGVEYEQGTDFDSHRYFWQKMVTEEKLENLFKEKNDLSKYLRKKEEFNYFRGGILFAMIAFFILTIFSGIKPEHKFYEKKVKISEIDDEDGFLVKETFEVTDVNQVYFIKFDASLANSNTELYGAVEVLDDNLNIVNVIAGDFWKASGRSGGENWSESATVVSDYFRFGHEGIYHLAFHIEKSPKTKLQTLDSLRFRLYEGSLLTRYFIIFTIIFLIFTIIVYNVSSKGWAKKVFFEKFK